MPGGKFAHLSGADDEDRFPFQCPENLFGEFDRDRRDRDRRRSDCGLATHSFGDGEGAAEKLVELSADGADGAGGGIGFLNLAENLRLADYHGIKAGSDAEQSAAPPLCRGIRRDAGRVLAEPDENNRARNRAGRRAR